MVFALLLGENGPAFVHGAGRKHITGECFARAARIFFAVAQIPAEQLHFFEVWFHRWINSVAIATLGACRE